MMEAKSLEALGLCLNQSIDDDSNNVLQGLRFKQRQ
jgi:hypothetical protein